MVLLLPLLIAVVLLIQQIYAGPMGCAVCCLGACGVSGAGCSATAMAPPVFIACVAAVCGGLAFTTCALPCAMGCFSDDTLVVKMNPATLDHLTVPISEVVKGDLVQTLDLDTANFFWSSVTANVHYDEYVTFVEIITTTGSKLRVTREHGMIVYRDDRMVITSASNLQIGDQLINSMNNTEKITSLVAATLPGKYQLNTEHGTVIASSLLVTTMCEEELSGQTE